jgi:hypothetical protein
MTRVSTALLALVLIAPAVAPRASAAGTGEPYIQARVEFASEADWQAFLTLEGLDVMKLEPSVAARIATDARGLDELRALGLDVTVEIEDMEAFYASRIRGPNFGDFHTFSETVEFLDELHATYPGITTDKMSIATTFEGRDVWAMKISDNPDLEEDEPEVLIVSLHHAREPAGLEAALHYMSWLCDNYTTDPEAAFLVDNRQIWFVPVVNPDGYCYNEEMAPAGGGMWRKNRAENEGSTCRGVDLNRNYPYEWGPVGSSGDPCENTYRGTDPATEPEVQGVIDLMLAHEFVTMISFHSVVGAILIPWGYTAQHTEDDALLRDIAEEMARYNGYRIGQCDDVLHYLASGNTGDYAYGEQVEKNKILSFCFEVDGSGFWPAEWEIPGLNEDCLWPQIYASRIAGTSVDVSDVTVLGGDDDGEPDPGETVDLVVSVSNDGVLSDVGNVQAVLTTDDPYVRLIAAVSPFGTIAAGEEADNAANPLRFSLDPETPDGHSLVVTVTFTGDGLWTEERLDWMVGMPVTIFFDDMETRSNWDTSNGEWELTDLDCHSPGYSYTDSPLGFYGPESDTWIELAEAVDLSHAENAILSFWHIFSTAGTTDLCCVEVSSDDGHTWTRLSPVFWGTNESWRREEYSLFGHTGTTDFKVRFRLVSDWFLEFDGWYVDDVGILGPAPVGSVPTAPVLDRPGDGHGVHPWDLALSVENSTDGDEEDELTYAFAVYADEHLTIEVASASGVPEGVGTTEWKPAIELSEGTYWWRAYADDGTTRSRLMDAASFTVKRDESFSSALTLFPGRPNPSAGHAELSFDMAGHEGNARLAIYSVQGRLVRTLFDDPAGPGMENVTWDGKDDSGSRVGSGLYLARLEAVGSIRYQKVLVLR